MSDYESVNKIKSLQQHIESFTGKSYSDLTSAVQALKSGYGSSEGGGSGIIDVTELPTSGIDENAVYRLTETIQTNVTNCYLIENGVVGSISEFMANMGVPTVPNYYEVDELPSDIKSSDVTTFSELHFYVLKTDGNCYIHISEYGMTMTVGTMFFDDPAYDKGSTDNAYAETEDGVYTTFNRFKDVVRYFIRENGEWKETTAHIISVSPNGCNDVEELSGEYAISEDVIVTQTSTIIDIKSSLTEDKTLPSKVYVNTPDVAELMLGSTHDGGRIQITDDYFRKKNGEYIDKIRAGAFSGCRFDNITIPNTVCEIGAYSFYDSEGYTVSLPNSIDTIPRNAFKHATISVNLKLPEQLKRIEDNAFASYRGKELQFPDSIEYFGSLAFNDSAMTNISLPKSLTYIGSSCFQNSFHLRTITFNSIPELQIYTFNGCEQLTTINVPWSEGEVSGAPWGATNATINYNYTGE